MRPALREVALREVTFRPVSLSKVNLSKILQKLLRAMREREKIAMGEFAARPAHRAIPLPEREVADHRVSFSLFGIANAPYLSLEQIYHHVTVAPFAKRAPGAPRDADDGPCFGRKRTCGKRGNDLLEAPAPDA